MEVFSKIYLLGFCLLLAGSLHQASGAKGGSKTKTRLNLLEKKFNEQADEISLMKDELKQLKASQANQHNVATKTTANLQVAIDELEETCESKAAETLGECKALASANEQLLRDKNANITNVLKQLQEQNSGIQTSVTALKQYNTKTRVSFSARVSESIANIEPGKTVVFKHVISNDGGGYSQGSGEFSAPVEGVYVFFAHILGTDRKALEIVLQVNGEGTMWLYANGLAHGRDGNMVVVRLKARDTVKVVKHGAWGVRPFYIHTVFSTFSGFLLY